MRAPALSEDEVIIDVATADYGKGSTATLGKGILDFTDFWFNAKTKVGADGIHIRGITPDYDSKGIYDKEENIVTVGTGTGSEYRGTYRLANLDGDTSNGYELLKTNVYWDLTKDNRWLFDNDTIEFAVNTGSEILEVNEYDEGVAWNNVYNTLHAGSPAAIRVNNFNMTVDSAIAANQITFATNTDVGSDTTAVHLLGFNTDTTFAIAETQSVTVNGARTTTTVSNTYYLAELDGDSSNGFEFLKKNDVWKLTPESWNYSSGTTKFSIALSAPSLEADADGSAKGISVSYHPSVNASGEIIETLGNPSAGVVIDFSEMVLKSGVNFADSLLAFDAGIATGKNGVHIKGLNEKATGANYSSQVTVGESSYWLVNLDNDRAANNLPYTKSDDPEDTYSNGLELAKVNDYWTPVYYNDATNQNWAYSDTKIQFTISANAKNSRVGDDDYEGDDSVIKTYEINNDGSVKYISVDEENMIITVQSELTKTQAIKLGTEDATLSPMLEFKNIEFASNTATGRDGIHIKGYDLDSTVEINSTTYQLVDLDGNANNGLELMKHNNSGEGWTYKGGAWSYYNETAKLAFSFDSTSGIAANDDGTPSGVTVATVGSGNPTITFALDDAARSKAVNAIFFDSLTAGKVQFVGLAEDTKFSVATGWDKDGDGNDTVTETSVFQIANFDNSSANGLEVMKTDSQWTLSGGAWKFADEPSNSNLEFSIASTASLLATVDGTPTNVSYYNAESKTLSFSGSHNFVGSALSITKIGNDLLGAEGLHIVTPTWDPKDTIYSSWSDALQQDSQLTINNTKYQLVNLDSNKSNGYELMKVDSNWALKGSEWTYSKDSLNFTVSSDASIAPTADGTPNGIEVNGNTITLSDNASGKIGNISIANLSSLYGSGSNAVHIVDDKITKGTSYGDKYRLIDLDSNESNGYELMKVDGSKWTLDVNGNENVWYFHDETNYNTTSKKYLTQLEFSLTGGAPTDDGAPNGVNVDMSSLAVTLPGTMTDTSNITLTSGQANSDAKMHFAFAGTAISAVEGSEIVSVGSGSGSNPDKKTYMLFNVDGNDANGLELTDNGWLPTTVKAVKSATAKDAFRYISTKANYVLSGEAFGTGSTPNYVTIDHESGAITISDANNSINTSRDAFHIKTDTISKLTVNNVEFDLRNADGGADNGYELVKDGWTKVDNQNFINLDGTLTLHTATNSADTDNDNVPDGITFDSVTGGFTFSSAYTDSANVTITANDKNWAPGALEFGATPSDTNKTYTLEKITGQNKQWHIVTTAKGGQLPANDAWGSGGSDVNDLLDYESPTAIADSELSEIMEITPLASDGADEFNVSTMFDGISDRTTNALALADKRRKQK